MHLGVIFSLKNTDAITADKTIVIPELSGYKIADGTYFAANVLKYEFAKRHIAITHITRNTFKDFPSFSVFSVLSAIRKDIKRTTVANRYV